MNRATAMVMISGIKVSRVNNPNATKMEQKTSAKVAKIRLGMTPIPNGSENLISSAPKRISFPHP